MHETQLYLHTFSTGVASADRFLAITRIKISLELAEASIVYDEELNKNQKGYQLEYKFIAIQESNAHEFKYKLNPLTSGCLEACSLQPPQLNSHALPPSSWLQKEPNHQVTP